MKSIALDDKTGLYFFEGQWQCHIIQRWWGNYPDRIQYSIELRARAMPLYRCSKCWYDKQPVTNGVDALSYLDLSR